MKNWFPSLVKNLEPLTWMVGMALTEATASPSPATTPATIEERISAVNWTIEADTGKTPQLLKPSRKVRQKADSEQDPQPKKPDEKKKKFPAAQ